MQRNRTQKGCIVKIAGNWCVRFADWRVIDGVRVRKQGLTQKLCRVQDSEKRSKHSPKYVQALAAQFMSRVNQTTSQPEMASTLAEFVEGSWLPHIETQLAASTVRSYKYYWDHQLKPRCGKELVRDYTTKQCEDLLREIARQYPGMHQATLAKLRNMLSSIFRRACARGVREGANPVREVSTPKGLPARATHAYSLEEIRQILGVVQDPTTRTLIMVAAYLGLAKAEIQGLTWESYSGDAIEISSNVVCGKRGSTKTEARRNAVPLISRVREALEVHRLRMGNPTTGPIFATSVGTPLDLQNEARRKIIPILHACECGKSKEEHGLPSAWRVLPGGEHEYRRRQDLPSWTGWHACRRGCASNLAELGVPVLTASKILRHSNTAVTERYYVKVRQRSLQGAMEQLERGIEADRQQAEEAALSASKQGRETVN